jgi:serine/threonine protein kinase
MESTMDDDPQVKSRAGTELHFHKSYALDTNILGAGAFSTVRIATHNTTKNKYAIKIVDKGKITKTDEVALKDEISVLKELEHPHIIKLYDVYNEAEYYFLVTELMNGGELFDRIASKVSYNEDEARNVTRTLLKVLDFCHSKQVAHRDLKPQNLLLMSKVNDENIKVADFGFAKKLREDGHFVTQCGTPEYVAPEILNGVPYDTKSDMWSMGCILYALLGGYVPFYGKNQRELFREIRGGKYEFHEEYWGHVSQDAKDLVASLLETFPKKRFSAQEALESTWMKESSVKMKSRALDLTLPAMKKFTARDKIRRAVLTVVARNKFTALGYQFRHDLTFSDPPERKKNFFGL